MDIIFLFTAIISIILATLFLILFIKKSNSYKMIYHRFKDVVDIEREKEKVEIQYKNLIKEFEDKEKELNNEEIKLKENYKEKRRIYANLLKEVSILEEDLDFISYGMYKPHFDFDTSDKYKEKLIQIRNKQKEIIKAKTAAVCHKEWQVEGSKAEGRKMTGRNIKLILRAFNNECDSSTLKVKWNNVDKMEERINRAFEALNKLGEPNHIEISMEYLQLKLDELHLAHEYQEKLYEEKEEQRRIREQIREEKKVLQEIEKAKKQTEQDEKRYQKALDQVKTELGKVHGNELTKLNEKMKLLENKLKEAQENKERALSRAQLTKSGHVYVISNIGSFGRKVFKIGMTRRLEPLDRVKELGDASVPFGFDIHAMIYSENAPELETKIHKIFNKRRVNLINYRKEFFYATIEELESVVQKHHGEIEFTKLAEAKEYHKTQTYREKEKIEKQRQAEVEKKFPIAL